MPLLRPPLCPQRRCRRSSLNRGCALFLTALFCGYASAGNAAEILTLDGWGPVEIGMSFKEAKAALNGKLKLNKGSSDDTASCVLAAGTNPDVSYLLEQYRVVRIDVSGRHTAITTAEGLGVGSTEAALKKVYGRNAKFTPHPYLGEDGHYVTLNYPARKRKLIFETDHGKVTSFRMGFTGPVDYIEGCQ
jgi:hypothetical protein